MFLAWVLKLTAQRDFWYHHTNADTFDKVDKDNLIVVLPNGVMAYVVAEWI
ncbi:MAG: hypothetical protein CM1200mP1_09670 [Candidatus Neomarinimicrobiota bacterium]|nr:MAG: hypothetical protein CM1200mP1_09670 [Candidatus Neomarinimicrobiota bacterium]